MEDEKIINFMKEIKSYFEPISNLIKFEGIEDYLYADTVGDVEDDDITMDYIFTLIDFMLDSQRRTKKETLKFYDIIDEYQEERLKEIEMLDWIVKKRMYELKESEKKNE